MNFMTTVHAVLVSLNMFLLYIKNISAESWIFSYENNMPLTEEQIEREIHWGPAYNE